MNRQDAKDAKILKEPSEKLDAVAKQVIGAAIEVHRVLGPGFLEAVYEEALCVELAERGLHFVRQPVIAVEYKGRLIGEGRLDLLVENELVVELKAVESLSAIHTAQVMSYLKTMQLPLALLINFGAPLLRDGIRRVIIS